MIVVDPPRSTYSPHCPEGRAQDSETNEAGLGAQGITRPLCLRLGVDRGETLRRV